MEKQLLDVVAVEPRPDHSLYLTFENGEKRIFDMRHLLTKPPFHRLKESPFFMLAKVGYGTVIWPGNIDIAPETLYDQSRPMWRSGQSATVSRSSWRSPMLELTKTPRTDGMVVVSATVPAERADAVARAIMEAAVDNIPAEDVFHDSTPGKVLAGARGLRGLTQAALAAAIGVHKPHISGMERDVRPIGKAMAKKLGSALEMNWRVFL